MKATPFTLKCEFMLEKQYMKFWGVLITSGSFPCRLNNIKTRFREETFTRESIKDVILSHPELVSAYIDSGRFTFGNRYLYCACLFVDPTIVHQLCDDSLP